MIAIVQPGTVCYNTVMNTILFFFIIWIILSGASGAVCLFLLRYPLSGELISSCLIISWAASLILVLIIAVIKEQSSQKNDIPSVK